MDLANIDLSVGDDDIGHMCVLGETTSGKTTIIRNLINKLYGEHPGEFAAVYWFGTNHTKEHHWLPKKRGQSLINPFKIDQIRKMMKGDKGLAASDKRCIIVFDDVLADRSMLGKLQSWYNGLIGQSRHEKITIIISTQEIMFLNPTWRSNIKKYFITGATDKTLKELGSLAFGFTTADLRAALKEVEIGLPLYIDMVSPTKEYIRKVFIPKRDDPFDT